MLAVVLSSAAAVTEIAVRIEQSQILIPVIVGKSRPLNFLLDTGAQATVIAADRVADAALDAGTASTGTVQGGTIDTRLHRPVAVTVGGVPLGEIPIAAVDLAGLSRSTGRRIDGILGYEFFHGRTVRIDYGRQRVTLLPRGAALGSGIPLRVTMRGRTPFVRAQLRQGRYSAAAQLLLDTGATGAVTLYADYLRGHRGLRPQRSVGLTSGAILPGRFPASVGRLDAIHSGALAIRRPVTVFSANADADDAAPGDAGLIGGAVLSRYTLSIDVDGGRARLKPRRGSNAPYEFDGSGLSLTAADDLKSKMIRLVLPHSPAAEAGIESGDMLVAVDGFAADTLTLADLRLRLRGLGSDHALQLRRGGRLYSVTLRTRRLI